MEEEEKEEEESAESDLGRGSCVPACLHVRFSPDFDAEGTVTPDEDVSQEMGDDSLDVTEDMRDQANEERTQGSIALAEGMWCAIMRCSLIRGVALLEGLICTVQQHYVASQNTGWLHFRGLCTTAI